MGLPALTAARIWIGNDSNVAAVRPISGDITLSSSGAVTISANAVETGMILNSTILTADLADNSVTTAKIAPNAVTTAEILNATILAADLADNAVTTAKINTGAVTTTELANNAVTSAKVLDATLTAADLAPNSVGVSELSATGTANATTVLRGNNTWGAAPVSCTRRSRDVAVGSGNVTEIVTCAAGEFATGGGCLADHQQFVWAWPSADNEWSCYKGSGGSATNLHIRVVCCTGS